MSNNHTEIEPERCYFCGAPTRTYLGEKPVCCLECGLEPEHDCSCQGKPYRVSREAL